MNFNLALIVGALATLLLLCALFPSPTLIMGITIVGSLLLIYQTFTILKERPDKETKGDYLLP